MDPDDVRAADLDGDGDGELIRMAELEFSDFENFEVGLRRLGREGIKRVVMAGAEACIKEVQGRTERYRHVVNHDMINAVTTGKYHEDIDKAWVAVYPQGYDRRGVSNAQKAFVINYGYGGRKTKHTGDKFITGQKQTLTAAVEKAMQAESDRIVRELNGG